METIRIGTRASKLAIKQTEIVSNELKKLNSDIQIEFITKNTMGDKILDKPLQEFGGKGIFISELENDILDKKIDLAVHSAKDLPTYIKDKLSIVGVLKREDPRDVLITCTNKNISSSQMIIGTSSLRRKLQIELELKKLYPNSNIICKDLRGNVQTRLKKLEAGLYDGIVLAAAGLKRLELLENPNYDYHIFDYKTFIPAACQGIIVVEGIKDSITAKLCEQITDRTALNCFLLERLILKKLNAGCHEPIGIYSNITDNQIEVFAINKIKNDIKRVHILGNINEIELLAENAVKGLK